MVVGISGVASLPQARTAGFTAFPVDGHLRPPDDMKDMNIVGAIVDLGRWSHLVDDAPFRRRKEYVRRERSSSSDYDQRRPRSER
jgi:hypothetical protein